LNFEIEGDESLRKFVINSNLENKNVESFNANGSFNNQQGNYFRFKVKIRKFNIATLNP
jgi:hypothetical protein